MNSFAVVCVLASVALSGSASARGGMRAQISMETGGALGTSASAPGTNSLGTALPSSDSGGHATKGPLLGTDPTIDKEDARLEKMLAGSICRGC
ncbi:hypothetical protein BST63_27625 [Bradyrhizobium canariense]|uniref:Secreted protein n=1 Tax=Bradyrhizobium canariense TaxID=255045 RepID=A0ABX3WX67_9BRAD|nr:hypothetical protein [Bradyrhizobium canariense]OSJ08907.1 hypothetical protein BSR47_35990 [Bradyrhizobium canariense]OSJ24302.1 hypothetical protein BST63_27625 [Bradyrhizobium canariense]